MPEARRIPLNWNALLGLSDLAGFRRKWAFKCAREPFTTVDISASRPGATGRSSTFRCTDPPPLFFYFCVHHLRVFYLFSFFFLNQIQSSLYFEMGKMIVFREICYFQGGACD